MRELTGYVVPDTEIRTATEEVPVEDYNQDADYGFGMKHAVIYAGYLVAATVLAAVAYGFVKVFF